MLFMCSMNTAPLVLIVVASCVAFADSFGQQSAPADDASVRPFAEVVKEYFSQWDSDGDGKLSQEEIEAAVTNAKFHDEAAAAIAAIEKVVRGSKYALPPLTKDYLVSSPLRE